MLADTFQLLAATPAHLKGTLQYLYHRRSGLHIDIIPLNQYHFNPDLNEVQYYGKIFSWWFAFQTKNYAGQPDALIRKGLRFYAECKLYPSMEILQELPQNVTTKLTK